MSLTERLEDTLKMLVNVMPVGNFTAKVFYCLHGCSDLSHVRLCSECEGKSCRCFEVVITPSKGKDVRLSLMHEWGHVYLATNYDISFAVTEACRGSEKHFEDIISSVEGYLVLQLTADAIVDYVVSKYISEYRNYVAEDVKERAEELLSVFSVGGPTDVTVCVTLAYLTIMVDATVSRTLAVKLFKILNRDCGINSYKINNVLNMLKKNRYVGAHEELLNIFTAKYFNTTAIFARTTKRDVLTGQKINYRCLKLQK